jgi:hypothetical protein
MHFKVTPQTHEKRKPEKQRLYILLTLSIIFLTFDHTANTVKTLSIVTACTVFTQVSFTSLYITSHIRNFPATTVCRIRLFSHSEMMDRGFTVYLQPKHDNMGNTQDGG